MTLFFGERWDAPIVDDAPHVDTPVGARCLDCGEPIVEGDQGFIRPFTTTVAEVLDPGVVIRYGRNDQYRTVLTAVHRECDMLGIVGHLVGVCSCTDYAGLGDRTRAAAREVQRRWPPGHAR